MVQRGMLRRQFEGHGLFVTVEKLGAVKAIAPDFHGKLFPGRFVESALQKKFRSDGESENGLQPAVFGVVQKL